MDRNRSRGFTLLELIVVLVIVGLTAGLVMPRLMASFTTVTLMSAAREATILLRQSRDTAYFKKQDIKAVFDLDAMNLMVYRYQNTASDENQHSYLKLEKEWVRIADYAFPEKITIDRCVNRDDRVETGRFEILFSPDGNSSGGEIFLRDHRNRELMITVELMTGTVRIPPDE